MDSNYKTMHLHFNAINSIRIKLDECGIPCTMIAVLDGFQLRFPWHDGDVVCHGYSYGSPSGCVESLGFPWDNEDVSVHTPEEFTELIRGLYSDTVKSRINAVVEDINSCCSGVDFGFIGAYEI